MSASDRDSVERTLDGEPEAFEVLVRKYNRLGGAIAYGVLGDFQLAEDVVQEAFLSAYQSLRSLRQPERFRVWFAGIVRRGAIDVMRKRRGGAVSLEETGEFSSERPGAHGAVSEETGPVERFLRAEERREILNAVASLPREDRLVLVLKHMEGLSYKEVAEVMDTTVSAVESRLFRARQALRQKVARLL